ncbi:MAG: hypothetical protein SFU83_03420 [Meiothermus sp.]|nr:hypothetical protein [Meiothermus sp.]
MKYSAVLGLLTSAVLFLAGCGQQSTGGNPNPNPNPTPTPTPVLGNQQVVVKGVDAAKVNVVSGADGKSILDESVAGNRTLSNLPAGTYGVGAARVAGYNAPELKLVTVDGGKTAQVELTFTPQSSDGGGGGSGGGGGPTPPPSPSAPPARLSIESVVDTWGVDLPSVNEGDFNPSKNVRIWASQTEEDVCVKVRVLDAQGNGVANAVIDVQNTRVGAVSVFSGCTAPKTNPAPFTSDANGYVWVRFFAPIGFVPGALSILPTISDLLGSDILGPVKVTMTASGTPVTEFKLFFINISHLYYQYPAQDPAPLLSERRTNGVVKSYVNIFKPRPNGTGTSNDVSNNNPLDNAFTFGTNVLVKQPTGPLPTGNSGMVWLYTVTGPDANRVDLFCNDPVNPAPPAPTAITTIRPSCLDDDGIVDVRPKADVGLDEMPLDITLNATLWIVGRYGGRLAFPLKSLSVEKKWIGTYLSIDKSVSNHVLTWAGSDSARTRVDGPQGATTGTVANTYTLRSYDAPEVAASTNVVNGQNVFTSRVTITVKNEGNDPAYNVVIGDALPAELGVLTDSASVTVNNASNAASNTYSANLHAVSFDNASIPVLGKLDPGQTAVVSFLVYIRQKPGFCWDEDAYQQTFFGNAFSGFQVKPISSVVNQDGRCPSDPYRVVNGDKTNDVTVTWYSGAPVDSTPKGVQVLQDYQPDTQAKIDNVEIWAVRPVLNVVKRIVDPTGRQQIGTAITYRTTVVNLESAGGDARAARYASLRTKYPTEFNGVLRDNPYARNVKTTDVFGRGLDFVQGSLSPLAISNNPVDTGANVVPAANYAPRTPQIGETAFNWSTIPLMGGGDRGSATYRLMGRLGGLDDPNFINDASWRNCAFVDARNLNQPAPDGGFGILDSSRVSPTRTNIADPNAAIDWYLTGTLAAGGPLDSEGNRFSSVQGYFGDDPANFADGSGRLIHVWPNERAWNLNPGFNPGGFIPYRLDWPFFASWPNTVTWRPDRLPQASDPQFIRDNYPLNRGLVSCVLSDFYTPGRPWIGLTTTQERVFNPTPPALTQAIEPDPMNRGTTFWYSFRINNTGDTTATDVAFNVTLNNTFVRYTTNGAAAATPNVLVLRANPTGTAGVAGAVTSTATFSNSNNTVTFALNDLPAGESLVYFIEATAGANIGTTNATGTASWTPRSTELPQPALPKIVSESTTVQ